MGTKKWQKPGSSFHTAITKLHRAFERWYLMTIDESLNLDLDTLIYSYYILEIISASKHTLNFKADIRTWHWETVLRSQQFICFLDTLLRNILAVLDEPYTDRQVSLIGNPM